jgi:hypothetical protein
MPLISASERVAVICEQSAAAAEEQAEDDAHEPRKVASELHASCSAEVFALLNTQAALAAAMLAPTAAIRTA